MKISLNWLKKYLKLKIPTNDLIELIGARLVEVEEVIDQTHKYDNIYIVKVIECENIPETHLHLCKIDIGKAQVQAPKDQNGLVVVVCGAPNVHAGMLAAWIAPGATVPQSFGQDAPFIIGTRKLRGHDSNGMLAGADELDFGTDHGGIVQIDPATAKPGDKLADLFNLNDIILDVENKPLTRRPDTFGIIGFAREVAGILGQPFKTPDFLTDTKTDFTLSTSENLKITITDKSLCPRYTALILERKQNPKPQKYLTELDTLLARSGMRPIDPIVDLTNYLMLLTGQPLHAFDFDKLIKLGKTKTPEIIVRPAKKGEKLTLLDDREVSCIENDILITSNNVGVALAGAMGAKNTAIDESTKKIILEAATFSLYNLRKTQMQHGIFSEAITRFTKGQPADQTLPIAKQFATLAAPICKPLAIFDAYPTPQKPIVVKITTQDINDLLGTTYTRDQIKSTLENGGFQITLDNPNQTLSITVPAWRTDIHIKEDITEEIGRLLGFDNIPPTVPTHATATKNPLFTLKTNIRNTLSASGANEVLTYSFISERLIKSAGQDPANSYRIVNSLSPNLQLVRQQLVPSLLEKTHLNQKDGFNNSALFEINQVYLKNKPLTAEKVPTTFNNLALVITADFYTAKKYLLALGYDLTFHPTKPTKDKNYFETVRSASIYLGNTEIGIIGEIKTSVHAALKLSGPISAFEISLEPFLSLPPQKTTPKISEFPLVERDLTLSVSPSTPFKAIATHLADQLSAQNLIFSISPVSIYQPDPKKPKNLTFHLEFSHPQKTLTGKQIDDIMDKLAQIN